MQAADPHLLLIALAGIVLGGVVRGIWRSRGVIREIWRHRGKW